MPERHYPGETIGIIGTTVSSAMLAQAAGKLGYRVGSLVNDQYNPIRQFANWQTVTDIYTDEVLIEFAQRVDIVHVEVGILTNRDFQLLSEHTDLTLSEDLMAITTDRLIEKVYLDSAKALVPPFSMVTNLEDIKEAIEYIGFPCVLKSTQRHLPGAKEHVMLYSDEDYVRAAEKVEFNSCILESWIPVEKKVTLTVVRNERSEMLIYPAFEMIDKGEIIGTQVTYPARIPDYVEQEINRLGQLIAESLNLIGSLTLEFLVTSAGVIYVNQATIGLMDAAIFTLSAMSTSHFEATMRATVGLPLPHLTPRAEAAIALPLEQLNYENVMIQYMTRTDWGFAFFNIPSPIGAHVEGQVIVTGDSLAACDRQIEITELYRRS